MLLSEEELKKSFESFWRNRLKTAEKNDIIIRNNKVLFNEFLAIYDEDKKKRSFEGTPNNILACIQSKSNCLDVYYAIDENNKILGFDFFYIHGKIATYLVGWDSNEGRQLNLNNLLFFRSMLKLKEKNIVFMDLGGIDDIYTENISKFKRGMKPLEYRLCGEFIK